MRTPNGGVFVAGAKLRETARLPLTGDARKVAGLIAAAHDAGRPSVTAHQLAERLGWEVDRITTLLLELRAERIVACENPGRHKPKRYRLSREAPR